MSHTIGVGLLSVVLFTVGGPRAAQAQGAPRPSASDRPAVGAFWSGNISSVVFDPGIGGVRAGRRHGWGGSIRLPLSPRTSIDLRAMRLRKGVRLNAQDPSGYQELTVDYLLVPVLMRVTMHGVGRPYIVGGADLAFRTSARLTTVVGNFRNIEDGAPIVRRADVSLDLGAGVERPAGPMRLFVEGLYAFGLRNVRQDGGPGVSAKTRALSVLVGVRY